MNILLLIYMNTSRCSMRCDNSQLMPLDPIHNCIIWDYEHRNPDNYISIKFLRGLLYYLTPVAAYYFTGYFTETLNMQTFHGKLSYVGLRAALPLISLKMETTLVTALDWIYALTSRDELIKLTTFVHSNLGIPQNVPSHYNVTCSGDTTSEHLKHEHWPDH